MRTLYPSLGERNNMKYRGITYPKIFDNKLSRSLWKRFLCPRNIHLFDEVLSEEHYLHCDACGLDVHILGFEEEKDAITRVKEDGTLKPFKPE